MDDKILTLFARGMTTRGIQAAFKGARNSLVLQFINNKEIM
jgi:transposase-like protein